MSDDTLPDDDTLLTRAIRGQQPSMSLGDRIKLLFDQVPRDDGKPYSNAQIAAGLTRLTGISVDRAYVSRLKTGASHNPTRRILQGLVDFFGVPAAYFFDDERSQAIAEEIELAIALRDDGTRALAVQLLRETAKKDIPLVADVVRAVTERPELRDVLELMLSLHPSDARLAGEVLRSVANRRESDPKD